MTNKLKSIDLFAGIGGIRLGFEKAFGPELETSFVSEWDQHAQKTYRANFSDDFEIAGDITGRTHQKLSNEPRYRSPFIGDLTRGTF